jgi:hypothetical protein
MIIARQPSPIESSRSRMRHENRQRRLFVGLLATLLLLVLGFAVAPAVAGAGVGSHSRLNHPSGATPGESAPQIERAGASPDTSPPGIVHSVNITIFNSESRATPNPFQQYLSVNSSRYRSFEAADLRNIEFYIANGTVIPSWLESHPLRSATNTSYWLKLKTSIEAKSELTVYMGFASPSVNLMDGKLVGEAPSLSLPYGEYDDGASVFNQYVNFAGTSLPSGWTWDLISGGAGMKVKNGLKVFTDGGTYTFGAVVSDIKTNSGVIEGLVTALSNQGNSNVWAMVASTKATSYVYRADSIGWQNGMPLMIENNPGGTASIIATSNVSPEPSLILGTYGHTLYANYETGATIDRNILGAGYLSIEVGSGTTIPSISYQWIRVRAEPPSGVMPSVCFGDRTTCVASVGFSWGPAGDVTVTVVGAGFGHSPVSLPFYGDTSYFRIGDAAQLGSGEYGFSGDSNLLLYQTWNPGEIVVSGFLPLPGDAFSLAVWSSTTGEGATAGGNVPPAVTGQPVIQAVSFTGHGKNLQITITGHGFGNAPVALPYTGDLNFFSFTDWRIHSNGGSSLFSAGTTYWGIYSASPVTLVYVSWNNTEIVIGGFAGPYGLHGWVAQNGDPITLGIWNTEDTGVSGLQTIWGGSLT